MFDSREHPLNEFPCDETDLDLWTEVYINLGCDLRHLILSNPFEETQTVVQQNPTFECEILIHIMNANDNNAPAPITFVQTARWQGQENYLR